MFDFIKSEIYQPHITSRLIKSYTRPGRTEKLFAIFTHAEERGVGEIRGIYSYR